ncbi:glycosyltransferase family 61 protein [Nocardioides cheoyonin]|uniref:glycosyltransferase family 61 protein n=1 Tax=Nocardioides cheoyonin TaxID=3156615 RepID=UPI0032B3EB2A
MSQTGPVVRGGLGRRLGHRLGHRLGRRLAGPSPEEALGAGTDRRILLLARPDQAEAVASWREHLAADRVTVVTEATDLPRVVRRLGTLDAVVCLTDRLEGEGGRSCSLPDLVRRTYRSLRNSGRFLVDRRHATGDASDLVDWLDSLTEGAATRGERDLAESLPAYDVERAYVAVTKRGRHLLALREAEVVDLLPAREPDVSVRILAEQQAGELVSDSVVHSHGEHSSEFPTRYAYPRLTLRHYEGPVVARGRTLMYAGNTVLPDSFRFHLSSTVRHPFLDNVGDRWTRLRPGRLPEPLPGSYYQLESTFAHHFGHVMAEVVSRLWGWDAAKRAVPDLKVLVHRGLVDPPEVTLEERVFEAYGISPDDIVKVDEPVLLESVVSATPMWHQHEPYYVHPGMLDTYERLARGFTGGDPDGGEPHERVFVSRGEGAENRRCRNQPEVEEWFADRGFEIVYPERHSLGEQVHLFRKAKVVAGFGGSGMFNVVHSRALEKLIVLNHEAYIARNEHMFCSLLGADEHYFWSAPDVTHPDGRYSDEAFKASWAFDFARNGDELEKAVGG